MATGSSVINRWSHCIHRFSKLGDIGGVWYTHRTRSLHPDAPPIMFDQKLMAFGGPNRAVTKAVKYVTGKIMYNTHFKIMFR